MENQKNSILEALLRTEQKNQGLLKRMVETQEAILITEKKRLHTERYKIAIFSVKFLILVGLMWFSFVEMKSFTQNLFQQLSPLSIMGSVGNQKPINNSVDPGINLNQALQSLGQIQKMLGNSQ